MCVAGKVKFLLPQKGKIYVSKNYCVYFRDNPASSSVDRRRRPPRERLEIASSGSGSLATGSQGNSRGRCRHVEKSLRRPSRVAFSLWSFVVQWSWFIFVVHLEPTSGRVRQVRVLFNWNEGLFVLRENKFLHWNFNVSLKKTSSVSPPRGVSGLWN